MAAISDGARRAPIMRLLVYIAYSALILFVGVAIIRSVTLAVFFPHTIVEPGARTLSPADRSNCLAELGKLHGELRAQYCTELRSPWSGADASERWDTWLAGWDQREALMRERCAVRGEQVLSDLYRQLRLERLGYHRLLEGFVSEVRQPSLRIEEQLAAAGADRALSP